MTDEFFLIFSSNEELLIDNIYTILPSVNKTVVCWIIINYNIVHWRDYETLIKTNNKLWNCSNNERRTQEELNAKPNRLGHELCLREEKAKTSEDFQPRGSNGRDDTELRRNQQHYLIFILFTTLHILVKWYTINRINKSIRYYDVKHFHLLILLTVTSMLIQF